MRDLLHKGKNGLLLVLIKTSDFAVALFVFFCYFYYVIKANKF